MNQMLSEQAIMAYANILGLDCVLLRKSQIRRIVLISNYAWTVYNFRLSLIEVFDKLNGYAYNPLLTQFDGYEKEAKKYMVVDVYNLFISRKGMNPFVDIITLISNIL